MKNANDLDGLKNFVLTGGAVNKDDAMFLADVELEELCTAADEIRKEFCGDKFDICTIINGKSGRCSENCKYCAQSAFYKTEINEYPLLGSDEIVEHALYNHSRGVHRYSIVTSGKALSDDEIDSVCDSIKKIKEACDISVCGSFGLLNKEQFLRLKDAGLERVHNNLESSENYFGKVCTTHNYQDKKSAINAAHEAGLEICSGGIMGLGESMEDRIDMALTARELGVCSVPINMLNPISGTPLENSQVLDNDTMRRVTAIYRFILPKAAIRLAGGRGLLDDKGKACFESGANSAISGDMLTTSGTTIKSDMQLLKSIGYKAIRIDAQ